MRQDAMETAEQYKKAHQRKNRWYRVVTCLAAVVVFCTTYALILPALPWRPNVTSRSIPTLKAAIHR